jgi:hypothetical protein
MKKEREHKIFEEKHAREAAFYSQPRAPLTEEEKKQQEAINAKLRKMMAKKEEREKEERRLMNLMEKNPENVDIMDYEVGLGETALLWRAPNPETGDAGFNHRNVARELREQHKASWKNSTKKRNRNNNRSVFSKKLKLVNERKSRKNRK